ncbi:Outer membrane protein OmpT [Grimontia indica]|uniref:Outer membrane protein OmpT n=1 Tax=Grimontia indica TaxID=1056512 RepID=R1GXQ3_9GAMM|nr:MULTISPECIES: porin [Grimontia]EOD80953.1 Outer membrane protein OmpT [Grimontia indica]
MKKTLLAVAIPAVLAAGNVNAFEAYSGDAGSVEVYGQLRATLAKAPEKELTLNDGSSRAGVNAQYSVTDDVDVFAKLEYSISYDKDALENRLGNFGFSGDFGKVILGKQYLTADDLWGVDNSYFYGGSHIPEGTISGGKHDSAVRYIFENDAIYIDASYALPEDKANAEVFELFGRVNVAGFDVTAGVSLAEQEHASFKVYEKDANGKVTDNVDYELQAGSLEDLYTSIWVERSFGDLNVGVQYAQSEIESDVSDLKLDRQGYALALSYALSEKSSVYGGYEVSEYDAKFTQESIDESGDATNAYLGAVHKFNSFFRVYGEVALADGKTAGFTNNKNDWAVAPGSSADSEAFYAIGARVYW